MTRIKLVTTRNEEVMSVYDDLMSDDRNIYEAMATHFEENLDVDFAELIRKMDMYKGGPVYYNNVRTELAEKVFAIVETYCMKIAESRVGGHEPEFYEPNKDFL